MKKEIVVSTEGRKKIMKAFGITHAAVSYALTFKRDSELSRRIRKFALQLGGMEIPVYEDCETIHDANGKMIQDFGKGVQLICEKETGHCEIREGNVVLEEFHDIKLNQLDSIQRRAFGYAESRMFVH
jgi:hypothetical protein